MNSISMSEPIPLTKAPVVLWNAAATLQCGFPSPAQDHEQKRLDLNTLLVRQPDATFFMRVRGDSMRDAGIIDGDYVIVDRSITPTHGHIVVAVVDGEFTVKRLFKRKGLVRLDCANPTFANIELKDGQELTIWGVVTWTFRAHSHHVSP